MCGADTSTKPRGGALVVLSPAPTEELSTSSECTWCGELTFHTPGQPSSGVATHMRLTATGGDGLVNLTEAVVVIHQSGDLLRKAEECGIFQRLAFTQDEALHGAGVLELELAAPVTIEVGDSGIIGRRVSIFRGADEPTLLEKGVPLAEGIVGFNFMPSL